MFFGCEKRTFLGQLIVVGLAVFLCFTPGNGLLASKTTGSSLQSLELPSGLPDEFSVTVQHEGRAHHLRLSSHSLRGPDFQVRVYRADGTVMSVPSPPSTLYRGEVMGEPGNVVVGRLTEEGLDAKVFRDDGSTWSIEPSSIDEMVRSQMSTRPHITFASDHDHVEANFCGNDSSPVFSRPGENAEEEMGSDPDAGVRGVNCLKLCEIAFDADFEYYQAQGSSMASVVSRIESHMNQVDFFYARDLKVTYQLTQIVVRTAPFYAPTGGGDLLDLFVAEWTTAQSGVVRDVAHLMTGKPGSLIEFGGLAYVGVVCNPSFGYGWSMDTANIIGHEVGHNWGAGHCHDVSPCNNMCGACLNIAPNTKTIMEAHRDSRSCLDDVGPYPTPVPPYAHPEGVVLRKDDLQTVGPLAFDVLGNDQDGNCDPLSLDGFDPVSVHGGIVTLSSGTGPLGRDELIYSPPATPFVGKDTFNYTVGDGQGGQDVGEVTIDVRPLLVASYWKLDDGAGTFVKDHTENGTDGEFEGSPSWVTGLFEGGLRFDGVDDAVDIPAPGLLTDELTISGWIKRNLPQPGFAGIVFSRDQNTTSGLHFGFSNELRYTWNGGSFGWDSGLVVPNDQWVFVALVISPDEATIYMDAGSLQSATNVASHSIEEFDGALKLGWDPINTQRRYRGVMDEVRIYDHALTPAEIADLSAHGGKAVSPRPRDGGRLVAGEDLSWLSGPLVDSHDVYFGTDHAAVKSATTGSPEYQGNQLGQFFFPGFPVPGTEYFWRIDQVVGGNTIGGRVWQFHPATFHHWRLDETSGSTAEDSGGGMDGSYQGADLGHPAATSLLGTAARFNGSTDSVSIPALNLDRNTVTMTAWVRRDGPQSFTGIVFSRDGSTTAGLNVGDNQRLGYHWNDDGATWSFNSGLVLPSLAWVFVALVVEPSQATLYVGDATLQSSVNQVPHAAEEFDGVLHIGRDASGGRFFRGWIDDVRIFDEALSSSEIQNIFDDARCGSSGTVNLGAGPVVDVLRINGNPRAVTLATGDPVEVSLSASPAGPDPASFALWVWAGSPRNGVELSGPGSLIGCTVNPTPLHPGLTPQPFRCLQSPGLPSALCRRVRVVSGPVSAPFALVRNGGLSLPATLTFQAFLQDDGALSSTGYSISNAVVLDVE